MHTKVKKLKINVGEDKTSPIQTQNNNIAKDLRKKKLVPQKIIITDQSIKPESVEKLYVFDDKENWFKSTTRPNPNFKGNLWETNKEAWKPIIPPLLKYSLMLGEKKWNSIKSLSNL